MIMGSHFWDKVMNQSNPESDDILTGGSAAKLRFVRSLYHRAISPSKNKRKQESQLLDAKFVDLLKMLSHNFSEFESNYYVYGSSKSKSSAMRMIEGKLALVFDTFNALKNLLTTSNHWRHQCWIHH
jgi:hypothetical protein